MNTLCQLDDLKKKCDKFGHLRKCRACKGTVSKNKYFFAVYNVITFKSTIKAQNNSESHQIKKIINTET